MMPTSPELRITPVPPYSAGVASFHRGEYTCPYLPYAQIEHREWCYGWRDSFEATYNGAIYGHAPQEDIARLWAFRNQFVAAKSGFVL